MRRVAAGSARGHGRVFAWWVGVCVSAGPVRASSRRMYPRLERRDVRLRGPGLRRRCAAGTAGFTLFEVILALLLLGVSLLMLVEQSAENTRRDSDRAARLVAHRTMRNEVQRLRASDPFAAPATGAFPATYLTDRAGNRIAAAQPGAHTVTLTRAVACLGGGILADNATRPPSTLGCGAGSAPVAHFTIRVVFPSRYTPGGTDALEQKITLWPRDRRGGGWAPAS